MKDYLRKRLSGVDIDNFSQEVARLALTLADVPNANGWSLHCEDMYDGNIVLERNLSDADIVFANPPFENFSASERPSNSLVNKAAEVVRQTMIHLPRGGIFGFVLPQTFLNSKEGHSIRRRRMLNECEVMEITLFADKVFEFGEPESVVILGHKPSRNSSISTFIKYQRVREKQVSISLTKHFEPSIAQEVSQSDVGKGQDADCFVPVAHTIWQHLSHCSTMESLAQVGQGFSFKGENDPTLQAGTIRYSKEWFEGAKSGFTGWEEEQMTHALPKPMWFNISKDVVATLEWN